MLLHSIHIAIILILILVLLMSSNRIEMLYSNIHSLWDWKEDSSNLYCWGALAPLIYFLGKPTHIASKSLKLICCALSFNISSVKLVISYWLCKRLFLNVLLGCLKQTLINFQKPSSSGIATLDVLGLK